MTPYYHDPLEGFEELMDSLDAAQRQQFVLTILTKDNKKLNQRLLDLENQSFVSNKTLDSVIEEQQRISNLLQELKDRQKSLDSNKENKNHVDEYITRLKEKKWTVIGGILVTLINTSVLLFNQSGCNQSNSTPRTEQTSSTSSKTLADSLKIPPPRI